MSPVIKQPFIAHVCGKNNSLRQGSQSWNPVNKPENKQATDALIRNMFYSVRKLGKESVRVQPAVSNLSGKINLKNQCHGFHNKQASGGLQRCLLQNDCFVPWHTIQRVRRKSAIGLAGDVQQLRYVPTNIGSSVSKTWAKDVLTAVNIKCTQSVLKDLVCYSYNNAVQCKNNFPACRLPYSESIDDNKSWL